jgi:excinuclease UvrABC helicase subunit UvrB
MNRLLKDLVDAQYIRNDVELSRGRFRVKGDTVDIALAYADYILRVELFGNEVDAITTLDLVTLDVIDEFDSYINKHKFSFEISDIYVGYERFLIVGRVSNCKVKYGNIIQVSIDAKSITYDFY